MKSVLVALAMAAAWSAPALANAFDDCVLENMKGTTSDLAAKSVKTACLRKNSVDLSEADLKGLTGTLSYGSVNTVAEPGFFAEMKNDSPYVITEITYAIAVKDKASQFFKVDYFVYAPAGTLFAGAPPDPTILMRIEPHTPKKFTFAGNMPEIGKNAKWSWYIAAAKGIAR